MGRIISSARRQLSASNVIAVTALVAALGTGAASALPGKNNVDANDIKANAVKAKQVKDGSLGSAEIADGTLSGVDVADNSLSGADINEATLGKVGAAATADEAVTADEAGRADAVDGFSVRASTGIVRMPGFAAGQNVCKTTHVDVPGVNANDHVVMTSQGIPTYQGSEQVLLSVHAVGNDQVEVQGCLSADTSAAVTPTPSGYMFLVIEKD
jgi:hypothetical protein